MWTGSELPRPPQLTIQAREAFRGATSSEGSAFMVERHSHLRSRKSRMEEGGPRFWALFRIPRVGPWASPLLIGGVGPLIFAFSFNVKVKRFSPLPVNLRPPGSWVSVFRQARPRPRLDWPSALHRASGPAPRALPPSLILKGGRVYLGAAWLAGRPASRVSNGFLVPVYCDGQQGYSAHLTPFPRHQDNLRHPLTHLLGLLLKTLQ